MPATADESARAADPRTDAQTLADLAYADRDLWPVIAVHPNAYPGLIDWMHQHGLPAAAVAPDGAQVAAADAPAAAAADRGTGDEQAGTMLAGPGSDGFAGGAAAPVPHPAPRARLSRRAQVLSGAGAIALVLAAALVVALVVAPRHQAAPPVAATAAATQQAHDVAVSGFTNAVTACHAVDAALAKVRDQATAAAATDPGTLKDPGVLDQLRAAVSAAGEVAPCVAPTMAADTQTIQQQAGDTLTAVRTVQGSVDSLGAAVAAVASSAQAKQDDAAAAAAATQAAQAAAAAAARTWHYRSNDGYTFDLNLQVGSTVTDDTFTYVPSGHDSCSSFAAGGDQVACETAKLADICSDFDPSTMTAVPVTATVTATTKGFDTPVAANFALGTTGRYRGPDQTAAGQVEVATVYSGQGPTCTGPTGYGGLPSLGVNWNTPMKTGATTTFRFDVILQKWRTPGAPTGDSALLDYLTIVPGGSTPTGTTTTYTSDSQKAVTLNGAPVGG